MFRYHIGFQLWQTCNGPIGSAAASNCATCMSCSRSCTGAAWRKRLVTSPSRNPSCPAAIAGLEQTLGVRLLDRTRRGVEPTIYGRALLNHGLAAFDALRQGVKEIEFLADPTMGELRIGCPEWIAAGLLPVITDRLLQRHPGSYFTSIKQSQRRRNFASCASGASTWCWVG